MNPVIQEVTDRIIQRSQSSRKSYLEKIESARLQGPHRGVLSCGNLAHGFAACGTEDKADLRSMTKSNIAIVSSYNDMLSAHQPYEAFPARLKQAISAVGSVAQFAGGVPCDKIVPGLLIGGLSFGHLPTVFVPAGPMPSGIPNKEKARIRQLYAQGKVGREELLDAESKSYHSAGTCTFYGTANSNQLVVEIMGLHLPGSSFVNPGTHYVMH